MSKLLSLNTQITTKSSRIFRLQNGWWPFRLPDGYVNTQKGASCGVIVDSVKSKSIAFIFNTYASGYTSRKAITKLGLSLGYKIPKSLWTTLTNKFYIGIMEYQGKSYKHNYPTFISEDVFYKCQEYLKSSRLPNLKSRLKAFRNAIWTGRPIRGYKKKGESFVLDAKEAPYIQDIFEIFCKEGSSTQDVISFVKEKYGKKIATNSVLYVLRHRFYGGFMRYAGEEIEHSYPRIIDQETFNKAQALIVERGHKTTKGKK